MGIILIQAETEETSQEYRQEIQHSTSEFEGLYAPNSCSLLSILTSSLHMDTSVVLSVSWASMPEKKRSMRRSESLIASTDFSFFTTIKVIYGEGVEYNRGDKKNQD